MPTTQNITLTGDPYINGVLGPTKWGVTTLTYSFPTSASQYADAYGAGDEQTQDFEALNAAQKAVAAKAFALISSYTNLRFSEATGSAAASADLRFGMSDAPSTAYAYLPTTNARGGDSWYNNASGQYDNPGLGNYAWTTFLHEIGHSIGLKHPHEADGGTVMPLDHDAISFTVMSYRSYVGDALDGYSNETYGFAQTYMPYDIAAMQTLYGANYATNAGDTVYRFDPNTGQTFVNGAGQGMPGANRLFETIWDGGGSDTLDFSAYTRNATIDLRPGENSYSDVQLANVGEGHLDGGVFMSLLHSGDTRSLIENATGGSGADRIEGNQADNRLSGGAGNDQFVLIDGGSDSVFGDGGDDGFYFGAAMDSRDSIDGGDGNDTLALQGNYPALSVGSLSHVEVLVAMSGSDTSYGDTAGNHYSYNVTLNDGDVAAGQSLRVIATGLLAGENLALNDAAEKDGSLSIYAGLGNDTLTGGGMSDGFFFGADGNLTGADRIDGGGGADTLALRGNYAGGAAIVFQNASVGNVEVIALLSGHTNEYSGQLVAGGFDYDHTMADGNVAAGQRLDVSAAGLGSDESVRFDGHLETNGAFRIFSGSGDDNLTGGSGGDLLYGGLGSDRLQGGGGADDFVYRSAAESTGTHYDTITGFDYRDDRIDAPGGNRAFDHAAGGALSTATFDANLASGLSGVLGANGAALFSATSGTLSGHVFAVIDANGVAGYQAGQDLVIDLVNPILPIDPHAAVII